MQTSSTSSSPSPSALLGIVAGIVIAIGSFLPWATGTAFGTSESAKGFDGWEGKVCLIAGAGIAIRSFLAMKRGRTRQIAAAILIGGLVATGVSAYTAVTAKSQLRDSLVSELVSQGIIPDEATARAAVQQAIDAGQIDVSLSFGLFVVIIGGVAAIAAGAMAFTAKPSPMPSAGVPAGGFGSPPPAVPAAPVAPGPAVPLPPSEPMPPTGPTEPLPPSGPMPPTAPEAPPSSVP